jgi:hypothetical protein
MVWEAVGGWQAQISAHPASFSDLPEQDVLRFLRARAQHVQLKESTDRRFFQLGGPSPNLI